MSERPKILRVDRELVHEHISSLASRSTMTNSSNKRRKLRKLSTKSEQGLLRRAYLRVKKSKGQLFKHPLFLFLFYIVVLYAVMIPVFYGCRPDRFLFGR